MKVKSILISQPKPELKNSPYNIIAKKWKVKIDFRPFIHVEGKTSREVRQQKIDLSKYSAIILTSRNSVDHFFRIAEEMRFPIPNALKYFCLSEAVAFYLQKYVVYRNILPGPDVLSPAIEEKLDNLEIRWKKGVFYKTVISDLSDLKNVFYDILVFFSPSGIESLFKNFPDFKQNNTMIAAFGKNTVKAAEEKGLKINIEAPRKRVSSMSRALEIFIEESRKKS